LAINFIPNDPAAVRALPMVKKSCSDAAAGRRKLQPGLSRFLHPATAA